LAAGLTLAILEMIVSGSVIAPWRVFASIVATEDALRGNFTFVLLVLGVGVHFVLSAIFGAVFGLLSRGLREGGFHSPVAVAGLGVSYGLLLWVLNFGILSRLIFVWLVPMSSTAQILLHAFGFGLPLGLVLWLLEHARHGRVLRPAEA
jgi:hypothetical protein